MKPQVPIKWITSHLAPFLAIACSRADATNPKTPPPSRPANATRPVMPDTEPDLAAVPNDLEAIPELGTPQAIKMRDGEIWQKYPSGLLIFEVRPGHGRLPKVGETVHVAYVGTFAGTDKEFDRATKDNPFQFRLGSKNIIKGWNLGLSTMTVGGKRRIWLPADLAYGAKGSLPNILPNTPLIFEIELLSITGEAVDLPAPTVPIVKPLGPAGPATATAPANQSAKSPPPLRGGYKPTRQATQAANTPIPLKGLPWMP